MNIVSKSVPWKRSIADRGDFQPVCHAHLDDDASLLRALHMNKIF